MSEITFIEVDQEMKQTAREITNLLYDKYPNDIMKALTVVSFTKQIMEEVSGIKSDEIVEVRK